MRLGYRAQSTIFTSCLNIGSKKGNIKDAWLNTVEKYFFFDRQTTLIDKCIIEKSN